MTTQTERVSDERLRELMARKPVSNALLRTVELQAIVSELLALRAPAEIGAVAEAYADLLRRQTDTDPDIAAIIGKNRSQLYISAESAGSPSTSGVGVWDGWVLAPREPTIQMIDAGDDPQFGNGPDIVRHIYLSMLAAAPSNPSRDTQPALLSTDETKEGEAKRFPKTLGRIHEAIDGYVNALVAREHGGVAQDMAFTAICEALGRNPTEELGFRIRALSTADETKEGGNG